MADSLFTKIIKGEIPANKIYEDELTLAFLDQNPKSLGHTLVVPKKQVQFVWDLPEQDYLALMSSVRKVANRIKEVLHPSYVGEEIKGMQVPHAHVHVFCFSSEADFDQHPDPAHKPSAEELAAIAAKLAF